MKGALMVVQRHGSHGRLSSSMLLGPVIEASGQHA